MYSANIHRIHSTDLRIDVLGHVHMDAAIRLGLLIVGAIVFWRPDTVLINLRHVSELSLEGVTALLTGYTTAIDYGHCTASCTPMVPVLVRLPQWRAQSILIFSILTPSL